jgi:hypothetical protein
VEDLVTEAEVVPVVFCKPQITASFQEILMQFQLVQEAPVQQGVRVAASVAWDRIHILAVLPDQPL